MRLAQMQKNVFELVSFLPFNINEKKKASKRGKKGACRLGLARLSAPTAQSPNLPSQIKKRTARVRL